ncbi:RNA-dependent RNA polymerase-like protein [Anopheles sinensis]|uniref:RNA-dependent RNA polymerase-like protein n=1 Tax=Anopheles sinensis TaxID=74873 RepID=A0A084WAC7_ANOSI|nr:RNA-dependent RNA polymerase-like protein [Anopheles sinensis]
MYLGKKDGFDLKLDPPAMNMKRYEFNDTRERPTSDLLMDFAISFAAKAFRLPERQQMLHLCDVFREDLPIWNSSPGLNWIEKGYGTIREIRDNPQAQNELRAFWYHFKRGKQSEPPDTYAYVESQLGSEGQIRVKWGYSATITLAEAMFAVPIIEAYRKFPTPIAFGFANGAGVKKKLFNTLHGSHYVSLKFENFQRTLPTWLILVAFDVIAFNIDFVHYRGGGIPNTKSMIKMYEFLTEYSIHTPVRLSNGERYQKHSGLASGSYFTELIESICNHILVKYAAIKENVEINKIFVLGAVPSWHAMDR